MLPARVMKQPPFGLFAAQRDSIRRATKRINIWVGPVRSGKTIASIFRFARYILAESDPRGEIFLCGRTQDTIFRNIIRPMQWMFGKDNVVFTRNMGLKFFGIDVHVVGANDERAEGKLRGSTASVIYCDEITLLPESFFKMCLSRLSTTGAKLFGSTNPDNPYHWFKRDYLDNIKLDIAVFEWPLESNPNLDPDFVRNLKLEYTGLWYKRFIDGLWVMAEGVVYDFFDEDLHLLARAPGPAISHLVAIDYGTHNPFVAGLFGYNPQLHPKIWLEKTYHYDSTKTLRQKTDGEYSKDVKEWLGDIRPSAIIVDPSAASFKLQLERDGLAFVRDAENDVLDGIRTQARMLNSGEYAILDHPSNRPVIQEYGAYLWDDKAALRGEDRPIKQYDHGKDMERYLLHTTFGTNSLDLYMLTSS